jgi:hypothetical protein
MARSRRPAGAGAQPLTPRQLWRAILLSTLLLVPAYWGLLVGLVSIASDDPDRTPSAGPWIAFGLCLIPFGFVAGVGAGGIAAMRSDLDRAWRARALAIVIVSAWAFVTVRTVTDVALLLAPVLPFTSLGVADHLVEIRREGRVGPS